MHRGYVKLWRKITESPVFVNEGLLKVVIWCLAKARKHPGWFDMKVGHQKIPVWLESGQFVFGRESASQALGMPASTVYKRIKRLKSKPYHFLNIESNSNYSIITVLNFGAYNDCENEGDSESNSQGTGREQAGNTNKKVNIVKKDIIYSNEFLKFWEVYPRKVQKGDAWKAWSKGNGRPDLETMIQAIEQQKQTDQWKEENGKYIPYPATWLRARSWEDEPGTLFSTTDPFELGFQAAEKGFLPNPPRDVDQDKWLEGYKWQQHRASNN